jgi:hypothetical protein
MEIAVVVRQPARPDGRLVAGLVAVIAAAELAAITFT